MNLLKEAVRTHAVQFMVKRDAVRQVNNPFQGKCMCFDRFASVF